MIKLIASDIDGTLLPYGQKELNPRLFPLIERLWARGVLFCPASGRQYHSLRRLFAPIADHLAYLCENGAILYGPGPEETAPVLARTPMPREEALALAEEMCSTPLPGHVVITAGNMSYLLRGSPFLEPFRRHTGNRITQVDAFSQIDEPILKVSVYGEEGPDPWQAVLAPRWAERFHMAKAGAGWLDFTLSDKGSGLRQLCSALRLTPEETAAFGDNYNDVAMLDYAGAAYLMEGSDPALKARFPRHCASVEDTLEEMLAALEAK